MLPGNDLALSFPTGNASTPNRNIRWATRFEFSIAHEIHRAAQSDGRGILSALVCLFARARLDAQSDGYEVRPLAHRAHRQQAAARLNCISHITIRAAFLIWIKQKLCNVLISMHQM